MTSKNEYVFSITQAQCQHMLDNSRDDPNSKTAKFLGGGYLKVFIDEMDKIEKAAVKLRVNNAVMYPNKRRQGVPFLTITGHCLQCNAKYRLTSKENPFQRNAAFLVVQVQHDIHDHPDQSIPVDHPENESISSSQSSTSSTTSSVVFSDRQLRGEERIKVMLSQTKLYNNQIAST